MNSLEIEHIEKIINNGDECIVKKEHGDIVILQNIRRLRYKGYYEHETEKTVRTQKDTE